MEAFILNNALILSPKKKIGVNGIEIKHTIWKTDGQWTCNDQ